MSPPISALAALLTANGLLFGALLTSPSKVPYRILALVFLPSILLNNAHAWQCGLGFFAAVQSFWAIELLLFRHPREDFQLIHRKNIGATAKEGTKTAGNEVWKEPFPDDFWQRVWWVSKLVSSHRFIAWETGDNGSQVQSWENEKGQSRGAWLLWRCLSAIWCFYVVDTMNSYQALDPYFLDGIDIDAPLPILLVGFLGNYASYWFMPRTIRILIFGCQQCCVFSLMGSIPAILCVSLGGLGFIDDFWGNPLNWPPLMGNPLVVLQSGLRGFWGKSWHQLFRNILADPGKALARYLRTPTKSTTGYVLQITVAFFLSGAMHALSLPRDIPDVSPLRYAGFFWIQGACVLVEVFVESMVLDSGEVRSAKTRRWVSLARCVWVVGVMYHSAPLINSELVKVGVRRETQSGGPISVIRKMASLVRSWVAQS